MMKKLAAACLTAVTMVLMVSCGGTKFEPNVMTHSDIGAVRISDGKKIEYGMKRIDVEKILGGGEETPVQSAAVTYDEGKISIFYRASAKEGAERVSDQQTVAGIMLSPDSAGAYETPRGLEAGATTAEVKSTYGEYPGIQSDLSIGYLYDTVKGEAISPNGLDPNDNPGRKDQVAVQFTLVNGEAVLVSLMDRQMAVYMN